jgi:hypothetical protein
MERQSEREVRGEQRVSVRVRTSMCSVESHHRISVSLAVLRPLVLRAATVMEGAVADEKPRKVRK